MELSLGGGEVVGGQRKRACSSATDEDRISALSDDLVLLILHFLDNAADAARTSVLSRRWRPVWTLLQDLRVPFFPEPLSFRRALTASQLCIHSLEIEGNGATAESLHIWLPAAARLLGSGGTLVLVNHAPADLDPDMEETPMTSCMKRNKIKDWFQIPCFEKAAEIKLDLGFLGAFMPWAGVFSQLTVLVLERVWFYGLCALNDVVSSPRCPCLQVLKIRNARGLSELAINSESLLELELSNLDSLWELTVEAAALKELAVVNCFVDSSSDLIAAATISAPQLVFLYWRDSPGGQCSVELVGPMLHLQSIGELSYVVYGVQGVPNLSLDGNSACLKLLQPFKTIKSLVLQLLYFRELGSYQYIMEDMKVLPNLANLYLTIVANGHSFGASSFHVLRMCLGIKNLVLLLLDNVKEEAQTPCLLGCVCDEHPNWKTEELFLINLQEIEIQLLRGSKHEVSFVKRLLNWAPTLNKMTVTLSSSTTESNAKEFFQMFESLTKPGVCIELMCHDHKVLYATSRL